jgi:imidazolonepropionase-like amidohydrolase
MDLPGLRRWSHRCCALLSCSASLLTTAVALHAQERDGDEPLTLFQNVRIFDGKSETLSGRSDVLIRGNKIERISTEPITLDNDAKATIIAADGRVLMPGLIDAHWHMLMAATPQPMLMTADPAYVQLRAARLAEATLMRFTTVRDMGGPTFGLKRAIDEGLIKGPRIYPSGAFISQTSGHGDFRFAFELPRKPGGPLSYSEREGIAAIADSPDEVRLRAREQLRLGASQIKLMAGGGVASPYNPIESTQYTERELRAAVEAAENWGTYVTVHAYTPRAIQQASAAGVKCIEHGHLIDEPTAKLMAEEGIWWSLQPFLDDEDASPVSPQSRKKALEVFAGTDRAYQLAKKYKIKTLFGTDLLFDAKLTSRQGAQLVKLQKWYAPHEALRSATAHNGELLALTGFINPYPRQARGGGRRSPCGPAIGGGQSLGGSRPGREPRQELCGDYEGRSDLQTDPSAVVAPAV